MATLSIFYEAQPGVLDEHTFRPLLELSLAQTNSQGAYLYRLDGEQDALQLAAWSGRAASDIDRYDVALGTKAARWHLENTEAVFLERAAWSDWRLERFPEFLRNRFEAAAVIPLLDRGLAAGLLHVARGTASGYGTEETSFLRSVGMALGGLLAHSAARVKLAEQVESLQRKLADRKLVERAKGILQASFQWTEEEAYLFLRRSSRQRRTAMRQIAEEVIAQELVTEPLRSAQ